MGRVLKKLSKLGYLSLITFPGRHGTAVYLQNYLSTMFQISDVMIDKEEVSMALNIKIDLSDEDKDACVEGAADVSKRGFIVSKSSLT